MGALISNEPGSRRVFSFLTHNPLYEIRFTKTRTVFFAFPALRAGNAKNTQALKPEFGISIQ